MFDNIVSSVQKKDKGNTVAATLTVVGVTMMCNKSKK